MNPDGATPQPVPSPCESGPDFARRQHRERFGPQPGDSPIEVAAKELSLNLSPAQTPLDFFVGTGSGTIFLYFQARARPGMPTEWMGFPVVVRERMGRLVAN